MLSNGWWNNIVQRHLEWKGVGGVRVAGDCNHIDLCQEKKNMRAVLLAFSRHQFGTANTKTACVRFDQIFTDLGALCVRVRGFPKRKLQFVYSLWRIKLMWLTKRWFFFAFWEKSKLYLREYCSKYTLTHRHTRSVRIVCTCLSNRHLFRSCSPFSPVLFTHFNY